MSAAAYLARQAFMACSEGAVHVSKPAIGALGVPGTGVGAVVGAGAGVAVPVGVGAGQDAGGTVQTGGGVCAAFAPVTAAAPGVVAGWGWHPPGCRPHC